MCASRWIIFYPLVGGTSAHIITPRLARMLFIFYYTLCVAEGLRARTETWEINKGTYPVGEKTNNQFCERIYYREKKEKKNGRKNSSSWLDYDIVAIIFFCIFLLRRDIEYPWPPFSLMVSTISRDNNISLRNWSNDLKIITKTKLLQKKKKKIIITKTKLLR